MLEPKHPFDYHKPSEKQVENISLIRESCKSLYELIQGMVGSAEMEPRCAALARTNLEQVSMWANKAIVMSDEGPVGNG